MNMMMCGLPGTGKTELLKFLTGYIPDNERAITIEDNLEIHYSEINPGKDCVEMKVDAEKCKKLRLSSKGIVKLRNKYGISQSELASLIGVSTHTVSMWEIGKVSPRLNAKTAICALRAIGKKELKRRLAALQEVPAENGDIE